MSKGEDLQRPKGFSGFGSKKLAGFALATYLGLFAATPAHAGPLAAVVPIVIGAVVKSAVVKIALTLAASVALSALQKKKRPVSPGITIEQTLNGGVNARTIIAGLYATAGSNVTPPMSYGNVNKTPHYYLVKVIAFADVPLDGISRLILNGEYVPLIPTGGNNYDIGGKYFGKARMTFYDGRQSTADSALVAALGSYSRRPWTFQRIGTGVSYGIFYFSYDPELYKQEPDIRVEVRGMRFYDIRKDSTAGGAGSHRWNSPATWEHSTNPFVMIYTILRGIDMAGGVRYGGDCAAEDLPTANWVAAMNVCDETVTTLTGIEKRYQAGYEWTVDDEPAAVIEELLKAASGEIVENGGVYKVRAGAPGLPVLFVTDEDFLFDKDEELEPFPSINGSINTVRASFPHPEEIWQPHDAPQVQNQDYVAQDDGQELVADLQFPAVPFPTQVQRIMMAWLEDDRKWRRHTGVLSQKAFALEPLDVISWTSAHNGYVNKLFDTALRGLNLYNLQNSIAIREVDPADYNWDSGMQLPDPIADGSWDLPAVQAVPGFAASPWSIKDSDSDDRRPAIRAVWDPEGAVDATALRIEVRVAVTEVAVASFTVANVDASEAILSEGILPATTYEVRAQYLVDRPTEWTSWIGVTTGNIKLGEKDLDFDEMLETLGPSIVIPQITKPIRNDLIQTIIDISYNDVAEQRQNLLQIDAFEGIFGNVAAIRQETIIRLNADEAFVSQLNVQIARIDANASSILQESITRASADSALSSRIDQTVIDIGGNTAAIGQEIIARGEADNLLASDILDISSRLNDFGGSGLTAEARVTEVNQARIDGDEILAEDITEIGTRLDNFDGTGVDVEARITQVNQARIDGDSGLGTQINNINVRLNNFDSSGKTAEVRLSEVNQARIDGDGLLGTQINSINLRLDNFNSSGQTAEAVVNQVNQARIDGDNIIAGNVNSLNVRLDDFGGSGKFAEVVVDEVNQARIDGDGLLATDISNVSSRLNNFDNTGVTAETRVTEVNSASLSRDSALAGNITTVTTRLNTAGGPGVTVEQALTTQGSSITGLQGQYTLRINNNGRISGFGLASGSGGDSEFSILANRFIVVDPANNATIGYPFQVVGGAVYIRKAFIQSITADQLDVDSLSAVSATIGDLDIRPANGQGGRVRIFDEDDDLRVVLGRLN